MKSVIVAFLALYATVPDFANVPAFLDQAGPQTPYPYSVYSQIPTNSLQGAYGTTTYIEGAAWQFAFYALDKNSQRTAVALDMLETLNKTFDANKQLALSDANAVSLSFRRTCEPIVRSVGWDELTGKQVFQALSKYELENQNQFGDS